MKRLNIILQLLRYFGLHWLLFRLFYAFRLRTGWFHRQFPPFRWEDRPLSFWLRPDVPASSGEYAAWRIANAPRFFFSTLPAADTLPTSPSTIAEADAVFDGSWLYFTYHHFDVGMPPNWHRNPLTGQVIPADQHWSAISDFDSGDIKFIWEASRFSVVFTLVRAYAAARHAKYALTFWRLVDDWAVNNPPQIGPNWKCGQEASFRVMAWCFGLYAFREHATPDQIARLVSMIAAHGDRIEGNIDYARSLNNNHGVSEGVGLWTIGTLFPELKNARRWSQTGKQIIEAEISKQVYDDGSYAQYSPNYQRVMLHDAIWALRIGELNGDRFPKGTYDRVGKSVDFLLQVLDPVSGYVPNHGANDSALVLPLNDADPNDFRPVIQAAHYLVHRKRIFDGFDADILWLFGAEAVSSSKSDRNQGIQVYFAAPIGGYYTLRGEESWVMVRCAEYRARPHHADQLHVDFWWRGLNICCDAGTYLYNGDPPWQNGLSTTAVHNTITIDDRDQMTPYSRFLWMDWSLGRVHYHDNCYWQGSHDGYTRLKSPAAHRRAVMRLNDLWLVVDEVTSVGTHSCDLHWLLPEMPFNLSDSHIVLQTEQGEFYVYCSDQIEIKQAEPNDVQGWRSRYYGQKESALSLKSSKSMSGVTYFWTILSPRHLEIVQPDTNRLFVDGITAVFGSERLVTIEGI